MSPRVAGEDANRVRGRVKLPENFLADKTGGSSYEHFHDRLRNISLVNPLASAARSASSRPAPGKIVTQNQHLDR